jgi:hypothetical protein
VPFRNRILNELIIGSASGPGLIIATPVPAALQLHYGIVEGINLAQAYIGIINDLGDYWYELGGDNGGQTFYAAGVVYQGDVRELVRGLSGTATAPRQIWHGAQGGLVRLGSAGVHTSIGPSIPNNNGAQVIGNWLALWAGTDLIYGDRSMGRGPVLFEAITSTISSPAAAAENTMFTTASYTFEDGRAYRAELVGQVSSTVIQRCRFRLRKGTGTGGTALIVPANTLIDAANTDVNVYIPGVFVNTSGGDITTTLTVTFNPTVATAVRWDGAGAAAAAYILVEDVGSATGTLPPARFTGVSL